MLAHAHHAGFGHGRFGQRRQHGGRDARGRAFGLRAAGVVQLDRVARARQLHGQQPAHEAGAQNHRGGIFEEAWKFMGPSAEKQLDKTRWPHW